jgi:hypothetical protein
LKSARENNTFKGSKRIKHDSKRDNQGSKRDKHDSKRDNRDAKRIEKSKNFSINQIGLSFYKSFSTMIIRHVSIEEHL